MSNGLSGCGCCVEGTGRDGADVDLFAQLTKAEPTAVPAVAPTVCPAISPKSPRTGPACASAISRPTIPPAIKPAVANDVTVTGGASRSAAALTALVPKEAVISGGGVGGTVTRDTLDGDGDIDVTLEVGVGTNCVPIPPVARSAIEAAIFDGFGRPEESMSAMGRA